MRRCRPALAFLVVAFVLAACSGSHASALTSGCTPGDMQLCACDTGEAATGEQLCGSDGTFLPCICATSVGTTGSQVTGSSTASPSHTSVDVSTGRETTTSSGVTTESATASVSFRAPPGSSTSTTTSSQTMSSTRMSASTSRSESTASKSSSESTGPVCVATCTTNAECADSCPVIGGALSCCDTATARCFTTAASMCPAGNGDAGAADGGMY